MSGIVGTIRPSPDGDGPVFEIVRKDRTDGEVRPCEHGRFKLDERWGTVTCGKCKGRVDPFAALLRFAEWFEALDHRRQMVQEAEKRLLVESLRRLKRLRDTAPEEVTEIEAMLARRWSVPVADMRALNDRVRRSVSERKYAKKRRKR